MRIINQIVSGFPRDLLDQVDADTTKFLRPLIKAPMVLILYISGVVTGFNYTSLTFLAELQKWV